LGLCRPADAETVTDPKEMLHAALMAASGLNARRRRRFSCAERVHRVAEPISDFSPLQQLPAFRSFQADVHAFLRRQSEAR
jgi:hypothetical protein